MNYYKGNGTNNNDLLGADLKKKSEKTSAISDLMEAMKGRNIIRGLEKETLDK